MQELSEGGAESPLHRSLSRRTVLRTAAHAAWAVPAIQVVSAAPAFAASGDALSLANGSGTWDLANDSMDASIVVTNLSGGTTTSALQVTAVFPNVYVYDLGNGKNRNLRISNESTGWRAGRTTYSGTDTGRTGTVVFTATAQLTPGGTSTLSFRANIGYDIELVDLTGDQEIGLVATATGYDPVSATIVADPA